MTTNQVNQLPRFDEILYKGLKFRSYMSMSCKQDKLKCNSGDTIFRLEFEHARHGTIRRFFVSNHVAMAQILTTEHDNLINCIHEVIPNSPIQFFMDIDSDLKDVTVQQLDYFVSKLITTSVEYTKNVISTTDVKILDANREGKYSKHIYFGFRVDSPYHAKTLAKEILDWTLGRCPEFKCCENALDMQPYAANKSLRCPLSGKTEEGNNYAKHILTPISKIDMVNVCNGGKYYNYIKSCFISSVESPNLKPFPYIFVDIPICDSNNAIINDENRDIVSKIVDEAREKHKDPWVRHYLAGRELDHEDNHLRRTTKYGELMLNDGTEYVPAGAKCPICNACHDSENGHLSVTDNLTVFMRCKRSHEHVHGEGKHYIWLGSAKKNKKEWKARKTYEESRTEIEFPGNYDACVPITAYRVKRLSKIPSPTILNYKRFNTETKMLEMLYSMKVKHQDISEGCQEVIKHYQYRVIEDKYTDEYGKEKTCKTLKRGLDDEDEDGYDMIKKINGLGYIKSGEWNDINTRDRWIVLNNNTETEWSYDSPDNIRSKLTELLQYIPNPNGSGIEVFQNIFDYYFPICPYEYESYCMFVSNNCFDLSSCFNSINNFTSNYNKIIPKLNYYQLLKLAIILTRLNIVVCYMYSTDILSQYILDVMSRYDSILTHIGNFFDGRGLFEQLYCEIEYIENSEKSKLVLFDRDSNYRLTKLCELEKYINLFCNSNIYKEDIDIMYRSIVFQVEGDYTKFYTIFDILNGTVVSAQKLDNRNCHNDRKIILDRIKDLQDILYSGYSDECVDDPALFKDRYGRYFISDTFKPAIRPKNMTNMNLDRLQNETSRQYVIRMMNTESNYLFRYIFHTIDWDCMPDGSDSYIHLLLSFLNGLFVEVRPISILLAFYGIGGIGKSSIFQALSCIFGDPKYFFTHKDHDKIFGNGREEQHFNAWKKDARYILWDDGCEGGDDDTTRRDRKLEANIENRKFFLDNMYHDVTMKGKDMEKIYRVIPAIAISNYPYMFPYNPATYTGKEVLTRMVGFKPDLEGDDVIKPYHSRSFIEELLSPEMRQKNEVLITRMRIYKRGDLFVEQNVATLLYMIMQASYGVKRYDRGSQRVITKYMSGEVKTDNDVADIISQMVVYAKINLMMEQYQKQYKVDELGLKYKIELLYNKISCNRCIKANSNIRKEDFIEEFMNIYYEKYKKQYDASKITLGLFASKLGSEFVFDKNNNSRYQKSLGTDDTRDGIHYLSRSINGEKGVTCYRLHINNGSEVPYQKWIDELSYMLQDKEDPQAPINNSNIVTIDPKKQLIEQLLSSLSLEELKSLINKKQTN